MLVSDRKRFIFLHNPKAAGSSIRSALARYDDRDNFYWHHEDNIKLSRVVDKAHITLDDFSVYPDAPLLDDYFVFGFVRNPYARVYSAFLERNSQLGITVDVDFNQFVRDELNEINIRFDWKFVHFCPQFHFFYRGGKCRADFIGRLEKLGRDFPRVINLANLDPDVDLPYLNRRTTDVSHAKGLTDVSEYLEKYDPTSLAVVNRLYDKDFVYFGYEKYCANSAPTDPGDTSDHVEAVYRKTRYVKAEDAYYATRAQKLSEETGQLRQTIQSLNEQLHSLREELRVSRQDLNAATDESLALRQKFHASGDELEARLREIQRMRDSRSWRMTRMFRRRGNWNDAPG